tara:strand:+ start:256 stop:717 length:462 start_codon:yes stop_codon:yes gene_type:complete
MVKLSKKTRDFLTDTNTEASKVISRVPDGASAFMRPGDIFIFRYWMPPGKDRTGSFTQRVSLVVRNKRTSDGVFVSTRNNELLSCFNLEGEPDVIVDTIVENLYKKRRRASYWGKIAQSLTTILGHDSYRTYKLSNMKQTYKVYYKGLKGDRR